MNQRYMDAHCHLQFEQYAADRDGIIAQMRAESVAAIVVGTDEESSQKAITLAEKHGHLFAAVGLHPGNPYQKGYDISYLRALAVAHLKVVAIGECGLDYSRLEGGEETKQMQKEIFKQHIALAAELDKPLMVHVRPSEGSRGAYQDLIQILTEAKTIYPNLHGDIHFFSGNIAEARALIALNFTLSFTAVITFARDYDEVIRAVPLARILAETDAPYVAPASRRGQRNDPLAVVEVVAKIAEVRGENPEAVRVALLENTQHLFALRVA